MTAEEVFVFKPLCVCVLLVGSVCLFKICQCVHLRCVLETVCLRLHVFKAMCLCVCDQELGKQKCSVYWPQETGPQHIQKYGDVSYCV